MQLGTTKHVKYNEEFIQDVISWPTARPQTSRPRPSVSGREAPRVHDQDPRTTTLNTTRCGVMMAATVCGSRCGLSRCIARFLCDKYIKL